MLEPTPMVQDSSSDSATDTSPDSPAPPFPQQPTAPKIEPRSAETGGLDIHSCLQFLLELYGQFLSPSATVRVPLLQLNETVKSVSCSSIRPWGLFQKTNLTIEWLLCSGYTLYKCIIFYPMNIIRLILTHCGLVIPYGIIDLDSTLGRVMACCRACWQPKPMLDLSSIMLKVSNIGIPR